MSQDRPNEDALRVGRYAVGDHVKLVYGREAGRTGTIVEVLPERWRVRYVVEVADAYRVSCEETDLLREKS